MIGIDIIEIDRIQAAIDRYGETFLKKVFTASEIQYCESFHNKAEKYAARFAVKEAVAKIIKIFPRHFFLDIEIIMESSGAPKVQLSERFQTQFPHPIEISMSHCKAYAVGIASAK